MLALLIDNDFREPILKGLVAREPRLDIVRVRDVGLRLAPDPDVLQWSAEQQRVLVTHDLNTMVGFAYQRVALRLPMSGLIAVPQDAATRKVIDDLLLTVVCYERQEIVDKMMFLPL